MRTGKSVFCLKTCNSCNQSKNDHANYIFNCDLYNSLLTFEDENVIYIPGIYQRNIPISLFKQLLSVRGLTEIMLTYNLSFIDHQETRP